MSLRRIQLYVDREVQSSLTWRIIWHWFSFLIACSVGIVLWTRLIEAPTEGWDIILWKSFIQFVPFGIIAFSLLPFFLRDTIRLSNRFAGPIMRVRRALTELADGKSPKPVEFRQGDFWKSLQHDLNRVLAQHQTPSESSK
jgi:hypothetical protein